MPQSAASSSSESAENALFMLPAIIARSGTPRQERATIEQRLTL
jgi:hypothetical protein